MKPTYLTLLFCLCLASTHAQEIWTLEQCVDHAMEASRDVELARMNSAGADIDLQQARQARLPSLSGNVGVNGNFGRSIDPVTNSFESQNFYSNGISLGGGVLLYNGGRINHQIKQAQINQAAALEDQQASRNAVSLNVVNAFLQVLLSKENVVNAREQANVLAEQVANTSKLVDAGAVAKVNLLTIEAQYAREQQNLVTAENLQTLNLLALKQLLWLEPDYDLDIVAPSDLEAEQYMMPRAFDQVYVAALERLPEMKASELRVDAAQLNKDLAQSGRLPSLSLGYGAGTNWSSLARQRGASLGTIVVPQGNFVIGGTTVPVGIEVENFDIVNTPYFDQLNNNINYSLSINAAIPIYSNGINTANIQRAELGARQSEIQLDQTRQTVRTNVQNAIANHRAAAQRYDAARRSLSSQQLAAENAQRQYDVGVINSYDLLNAQNAFRQVQSEVLQAKYDLIFTYKLIDFYMGIPITL